MVAERGQSVGLFFFAPGRVDRTESGVTLGGDDFEFVTRVVGIGCRGGVVGFVFFDGGRARGRSVQVQVVVFFFDAALFYFDLWDLEFDFLKNEFQSNAKKCSE